MSREEIVKALRELAKNNEPLNNNQDLYDACRELFLKGEILDDFDPINPAKMANVLEGLKIELPTETEESEVESKALNSHDLEILLDEYDEHRELKDAKKIASEAQKNPLLKRVKSKDIWEAIEKKIRSETEALQKGKNIKEADEISDKKLIIEEKLKEARPKEADSEITDREIETLAEKIVEIPENKVDIERDRGRIRTEQNIEKISDSVKVLEESRKEAEEVLNDLGIKESKVRTEAVKIAADITAERIVDQQIKTTVEQITKKVEEVIQPRKEEEILNDEQKTKIREVIRERVEKKIDEPLVNLNDHKALIKEEEKIKTLKTGPTLTEEIEEITERPLGEKIKEIETVVKDGDESVKKILDQNSELESITNNDNATDIYRAAKLEEEVFDRIVESGAPVETARDEAIFVRVLNFPPEEPSTSTTQIQAEKIVGANETSENRFPENTEVAMERAGVIKNLIKSPIPVRKNIERIAGLSREADGIKEVDKLKGVAAVLKSNPKLVKSLEFVQGLVKFQDRISQFTGVLTNPLGQMLKIPALQNFAVQVAQRFGGEMVGAMATHIAQFGLEQGAKNIIGQLFATGTVTAVKAGTSLAAQGAATAAGAAAVDGAAAVAAGTGVGIPVAVVLLGAQLVLAVGKKIFGAVKGKLDDLLAGLSIDSGGIKTFLQDNLGKGVGGMVDFGIKAGALLVLIPAMLGAAFAMTIGLVSIVVPAVFGLLAGMQTMHSSQVSTLVAPKGVGGLTCVKKTDMTATGDCYANCNPNAPATDAANVNKSLFVSVAESWRAGGAKNAEKCFYDVVCRAKNAGVNPDFALWAWLHESGASNYCGFAPELIEDFGIHNAPGVGKNNFVQQADFFMTYVGGGGIEGCVGNPLITAVASGKDAYWLAVSAYYLNGNCDPNIKNPATGMTAWDYLAELKTTWSWINSAELPNTAKITPGNCGGGSSTTSEQTDTSGEVWICEGESDIPEGQPGVPLPTRDPSLPVPKGCPHGWPLKVKACITQGSFGAYSHKVIEAYDFAGGCVGTNIGMSPIYATHDGIAVGGGSEASAYGFFVDVTGDCNGTVFTSRYAHMPNIIIKQNSTVKKGDLLGYVDNSGTFRSPGNEHLHYEFLWRALKMNDWVPEPVPEGCFGWQSCGSVIIND